MRNLIDLLYERIQELKQSARVESPTRPVSPFHTRNSVPTSFPRSQIHNSIIRSPSPWTPLTPHKSATFRPPSEEHSDDYHPYTSHQPGSPMIPIEYHPPSQISTEPPSQTTTESTSPTTANSSRISTESFSEKITKSLAQRIMDSWTTILDPPFSTIPESRYQPPARTSTRDISVNRDLDSSIAIPDHEHLLASSDVQSARPRGPMIPITGFRYSSPAIADPDSPKTSQMTADYRNTSPTIADYHGNSWTAVDYPDASRNVAESCYWPAIETSIKNTPEDSNLDAGITILDREYLPASPDVQSEVSDGTPNHSEPSPRIEDPFNSGFSASPEFDEAEEIIDFYLSFESDPHWGQIPVY